MKLHALWKSLGICGVASLALCLASSAQATTVVSLSLEELVKRSDLVVRATVQGQRAFVEGPRDWIYTVSDLNVHESLKGDTKAGVTLQVRQVGGTVGDIEMQLEGNANLRVGEEVLIFLDRDEVRPGYHYVVGLAQGKYGIDRSGPAPVVVRNLHGLGEVSSQKPGVHSLESKAKESTSPVLLDALVAKLHVLVQL